MADSSYLKGHFLIAMPSLQDPNFVRSVTFICEHNEEGAFGIVINHETDAKLSEILVQLNIIPQENNPHLFRKIFLGGPVDLERGLILHAPVGNWDSTICQNDNIAVTSSVDILQAIGKNEAPEKFMVCLGYAGWGPGQLEQEMTQNSWLSGPANEQVIFDIPVKHRWQAAASLLGVDLSLLSSDVGHA